MKSKKLIILLISILSIFAISLTALMFILMQKKLSFKFDFDFDSKNTHLVESVEYNKETINSITINVYSTDIEIKESHERIRIEYYSNSEKNPKIVEENNSIILDESNYDIKCIGLCNINRKVVLYLPSTYEGKLNIKTASGDIDSWTQLNSININTVSGDIDLLNVNNILVNTTSGDIEIKSINNKIIAKTVSGDVEIESFTIMEHSEIYTTSGDVEIKRLSNCYVDTHTVTGDIKVRGSERKSDLELKISTTSGDIEVN